MAANSDGSSKTGTSATTTTATTTATTARATTTAKAKHRRGPGRPFKKNGDNGEKDDRINRTGRPKSYKEFVDTVREELEPIALAKLKAQLNHRDPHIVRAAIKETLNRARGRAPQPLTGEGGEGPVEFETAEAELLRALLKTEEKLKAGAAGVGAAGVGAAGAGNAHAPAVPILAMVPGGDVEVTEATSPASTAAGTLDASSDPTSEPTGEP